MTTRLMSIAFAMLLATWGVAGCGGDDGEKDSPTEEEEEGDNEPEGEGCGPKICTAPKGFTGQICCQSPFEGKCGQMVAGTCVDLPPPSDDRCESTTFMAGQNTVMVPSCCTDSNECGLVFNAGFGSPTCTSVTQARAAGARFMAMAMGMTMMFDFTGALPEPVTCDGDPIEATE
jgi:hypothetical protein